MQAFHGDAGLKRQTKERLLRHLEQGQILSKICTWNEGTGTGSPVGCSIHAADLAAYEQQLGIPQALAQLMESVFSTNASSAQQLQKFAAGWVPAAAEENGNAFPVEWIDAIAPGADLSMIACQFIERLLIDPKLGAMRDLRDKRVADLLRAVAALHREALGGRVADDHAWAELRSRAVALRDSWPEKTYSLDAWAAGVAETACWPCTPHSACVAVETLDSHAGYAEHKAALVVGRTEEDRTRAAELHSEISRAYDQAVPRENSKTLDRDALAEKLRKAMAPYEERLNADRERSWPWQIEALKQRWLISGMCEKLLLELVVAAMPVS